MISLGRKNKSLILALAILATLAFVLLAPRESTPVVPSMEKADFSEGTPAAPSNDDSLLSGAQIEQDKVAPEQKGFEKTEKVAVGSGTDATLKSKQDAVDKADAKAAAKAKSDAKVAAGSSKGDSKAAASSSKGDSKAAAGSSKGDSKAGSTAAKSDYEYVIMIDAGSTGSRVHVYTFDTTTSPPTLINEEFEMLKPGLSSFDVDSEGAALSLDPLLAVALKSIPKDKYSCSPVAVKATAGLRLLGDAKSAAILKEVRRHLEEDFPFPVVEGDGVSIMDGSDEGVFAWITANYLLGNIGSSKKIDTAAVFDLGGGSTQIVFEPTDGEKMIEGEHKYSIEFGGRDFTLYQYSHLGYGLMQGRRQINAAILETYLKTDSTLEPLTAAEAKSNPSAKISIENPCVPPGVTAEDVIVEMDDGTKYVVNFVSPAKSLSDKKAETASTQCKFIAESILNKDATCISKSCSFNGVFQPSLKNQFSALADMYVFSYFYDRLEPIGMPLTFTLGEMQKITEQVCAGSSMWDQYFKQAKHIKELETEPLWCQDLVFMTSLLHVGYDIPLSRELKTAKTIEDNELGWCLGASLPLLDGKDWKCKVTKEI
ncbi:guanosine diphosphatase [Martiniozyma asiatica (nom. inval.)]|nr:guanosine diphosphatase [Martiniozyma asiatica]